MNEARSRKITVETSHGEDVQVEVTGNESPRVVQERAEQLAATAAQTASGKTVSVRFTAEGQAEPPAGANELVFVPSDAPVTIWGGLFDETPDPPVGEANAELAVNIQRPDGGTSERTITTDNHGSGTVEYDLTDRDDGVYVVTVEYDDGSAQASFHAGLKIESTTGDESEVHVDQESTFPFLVRNGESPVQDVSLDLRVVEEGETITSEGTVTDENGFTSIAFTPDQPGQYTVEAEHEGEVVADVSVTAGDYVVATDFLLMAGVRNHESTMAGYLSDADGHVPNTDFELHLSEFGEEPFFEDTVTTTDGGFFTVDLEIDDDITSSVAFAEAQRDDDEIPITYPFIFINDPPDTTVPDPDPVELTAEFGQSSYPPGEDVQISFQVTEDGSPLTDAAVGVFVQYDDTGPPVHSTVVTTDEEGTGTVSFELPTTAPDNVSLDASLAVEVDDEVYTAAPDTSIEAYDIEVTSDFQSAPGEDISVAIDARDAATEDPVAGVPLSVDGRYRTDRATSFGTAGTETGADGQGETTLTLPDDAQYSEAINRIHRYDRSSLIHIYTPAHPGTLSVSSDAIEPGSNVDLVFDSGDGAAVSGLVYLSTFSTLHSVATPLSPDGTATLQVPTHVEDADLIEFGVWAVDGDQLYADSEFGIVEAPDTVSVSGSFSADPIEVGGETTLHLDTTNITEVVVDGLWQGWDVTDYETAGGSFNRDGRTATFTYDSQVSLTPDLTLVLSKTDPRYDSGDYLLKLWATSGSDTDTGEVTLTIDGS